MIKFGEVFFENTSHLIKAWKSGIIAGQYGLFTKELRFLNGGREIKIGMPVINEISVLDAKFNYMDIYTIASLIVLEAGIDYLPQKSNEFKFGLRLISGSRHNMDKNQFKGIVFADDSRTQALFNVDFNVETAEYKVEPVDLVFYSETLSMPPDNKAIKAVVNFDAFFSKIDGFIVASKSMCFKVSKHQDKKVVSLPFDSKELSATLG